MYKINAEGDCPPYPIKCYASEWSGDVGEGEGPEVTYLGSFTEEFQQPFNVPHINYGVDKNLKRIDYFFGVAMKLAKEDLKLKSNVSIKIKEDVINDANIRSKVDILNDYNIDEDRFDIKYKSYEHVFNISGHPQDGTVGMFDYDFYHDFQSINADERLKAYYSTHQRIVNRVITALDAEKEDLSDEEIKQNYK